MTWEEPLKKIILPQVYNKNGRFAAAAGICSDQVISENYRREAVLLFRQVSM